MTQKELERLIEMALHQFNEHQILSEDLFVKGSIKGFNKENYTYVLKIMAEEGIITGQQIPFGRYIDLELTPKGREMLRYNGYRNYNKVRVQRDIAEYYVTLYTHRFRYWPFILSFIAIVISIVAIVLKVD